MNEKTEAILSDLNDPQRAAVESTDGPLLVLAGAGSGKTRVVTRRIAYLIEARKVAPERILAVTFTKKAAREMEARIKALLGDGPLPWTGTFHGYCARFLRRHISTAGLSPAFVILDRSDQMQVVRDCLEKLHISDSLFPPKEVLNRIGRLKGHGFEVDDPLSQDRDFADDVMASIAAAYRDQLRRMNALDFDDLLLFALQILESSAEIRARYQEALRYVHVDEFQDTNRIQYKIMRILAAPSNNLCAVGDDDQSIYRWRGAEASNMRDFTADFPGARIVRLEENYRSTGPILETAWELVKNNRTRFEKKLFTRREGGEKVVVSAQSSAEQEAAFVADRIVELRAEDTERYPAAAFAVLYRTNAQSRLFEEALRKRSLPFSIVGGVRFFARKEVKDCLSYLRIAWQPADDQALLRILNVPSRGLGDAAVRGLQKAAAARGVSLWACIEEDIVAGRQLRSWQPRFAALADIVYDIRSRLSDGKIGEALKLMLAKTDYLRYLERDDPATFIARKQNIDELVNAAASYEEEGGEGGIDGFLDNLALSTDIDGWDKERGVSLMTLHNAKGLEFPVVFIAGLEEKLIPHAASEDLEEERRLLYVGITRAKERLFLVRAQRRKVFGRDTWPVASRFLHELPEEPVARFEAAPVASGTPEQTVKRFFGGPQAAAPAAAGPPGGAADGTPGKGKKVWHPKYGEGVILACDGVGDAMKLTVSFRGYGKKRLIWKYAQLEVIG